MPLPELAEIHENYLTLSRIAGQKPGELLGGKVLLAYGQTGLAFVVAASIAGAASLWVADNPEILREAMRTGLCDFVVRTLDEALRILKNEVRRQRPVSVGLSAGSADCLREMVDRGFQPDLIATLPAAAKESIRSFVDRGAIVVSGQARPIDGTSLLWWSVESDAAKTMPRIGEIAADALDPDRTDTPARIRWIETAPRFLGRAFARQQCLRMDRHESARFAAIAQAEYPSLRIDYSNAGT